jgi:hypothetical protein
MIAIPLPQMSLAVKGMVAVVCVRFDEVVWFGLDGSRLTMERLLGFGYLWVCVVKLQETDGGGGRSS